jgi:endonuclease YncB( thermonuclease family)
MVTVAARKTRERSGLPLSSWRKRLRSIHSCIENLLPSSCERSSDIGKNRLLPLSMAPRTMFSFRLFALLLSLLLTAPSFANDPATLVRVVAGDTIEIMLNGQKEKVRLLGVDTPEKFASDKLHRDAARIGQDEVTIQALGERASAFTKSLVQRGDTVQVEYDQQPRDKSTPGVIH